jgi:predicted nucleotide-binding protein
MKPKVFIESSGESKRFAIAIHGQLAMVAECTPWVTGFDLSKSTLDGLMRNVRESDFGVFVFSADDVLTMRGSFFTTTRDNVVYEAVLLTGYLGPERCLIAIPAGNPHSSSF